MTDAYVVTYFDPELYGRIPVGFSSNWDRGNVVGFTVYTFSRKQAERYVKYSSKRSLQITPVSSLRTDSHISFTAYLDGTK